VLLTRSDKDAAGLAARLAQRGVVSVVLPLITRTAVPWEFTPAMRAAKWVVLSSRAAAQNLSALRTELKNARLAVVGPGTAAAAELCGWTPDLIGDGRGADSLVEALARSVPLQGVSCLWLRGEEALPLVREKLQQHGAQVHEAIVYRTTRLLPEANQVREALRDISLSVLASPSAVLALTEALQSIGLCPSSAGRCVAIGQSTADALVANGFRDVHCASLATDVALEHAIMKALGSEHG
jgi:uroporphyrinogen-III synthase